MTIAEQLTSIRKKKGMTQEFLSEISGLSLRTIQRVENGSTIPRAHTVKVLARHLGIEFDQLTASDVRSGEVTNSNISALQRMNATGLAVLLFPVLPVVLSSIIWNRHRNESEAIRTTGKRIIAFQLLWIVFTLFVLITTKVAYYYITGYHAVGHTSPLLPPYLLMVGIHLVIVIYAAARFQKQENDIYRLVPLLF